MTTLINRYRELPAIAGALLLPVGFLARLPMSMLQLGSVLLVSTETGSIAFAGLVAGALALGQAVGGPLIGKLADVRGQRPVIVIASLLNGMLAVLLVLDITLPATRWLTLVTALGVGATMPQIGPLLRSRWVSLASNPAQLSTAMSYEGVADEVSYVLGPAVVSLLALLSPPAAMIGAAAIVMVFGTLVGLHPTAAAARPVPADPGASPVWRDRVVARLLIIALTMGVFFGGTQTGVTAVATTAGSAGSAGLLYAVMAIGSAVAGLATSALPARFALPDRMVVFSSWLAVMMIPLVFLSSVPVVATLLLILGTAVGPTLITMYSLAERQVAAGRTGVTLTLISAASVVGYSLGSSMGGNLAQSHGSGAAFAVALGGIGVGAVIAVQLRRVIGSADSAG